MKYVYSVPLPLHIFLPAGTAILDLVSLDKLFRPTIFGSFVGSDGRAVGPVWEEGARARDLSLKTTRSEGWFFGMELWPEKQRQERLTGCSARSPRRCCKARTSLVPSLDEADMRLRDTAVLRSVHRRHLSVSILRAWVVPLEDVWLPQGKDENLVCLLLCSLRVSETAEDRVLLDDWLSA